MSTITKTAVLPSVDINLFIIASELSKYTLESVKGAGSVVASVGVVTSSEIS